MSETETPFMDKICPLIDRKCIKEECVAYNKHIEMYYVSNGSEELEIIIPYKSGKRDKLLRYNIFEANIDKKNTRTHLHCKNYDKSHMSEETEEVNEELFYHGEAYGRRYEHKGIWVKYENHNTDSKTAIDGKWEYNHNV